MCFLKEDKSDQDGKTSQTARCIKSRMMTKVIDYVLSIDTFEQQCVVIKGMLQSPRLKYHVQTIGIDQYLSNNFIYEHKCLENIKNYTNKLVSVTNRNNSRIFLSLLWFLPLKDSPTTVLYLPGHQKTKWSTITVSVY